MKNEKEEEKDTSPNLSNGLALSGGLLSPVFERHRRRRAAAATRADLVFERHRRRRAAAATRADLLILER